MRNRLFFPAVLFTLMLQAALVQSQQLTIQTEAGTQPLLARADVEALPRIKATSGASGASATFEGVGLKPCWKEGSWVWGDSEEKTIGVRFVSGSC